MAQKNEGYYSESKRREKELTRERDLLASVLDFTPTFLVVIDGAGKVLKMNKMMLEATGYRLEEAMGADYISTFVPAADREKLVRVFQTLVDQHEPTRNENYILARDGRKILVEWHGRPFFKEGGTFDFFYGVGIDITERRRAERQLQESRQQLSDIVNFLPDATFAIDIDGRVIVWNRAIEELTGINKEKMLGKGDYEYAIPFYGERRPCLANIVIHNKLKQELNFPWIMETDDLSLLAETFCPKIGETGIYVWAKATPLYDLEGNVVGAIETVRDVTERKQFEEAMLLKERKFQAAFEGSHDAITIVTMGGKLVDCNQRALEIYGLKSKEEFLGARPADFSPPAQPDGRESYKASRQFIQEAITKGEPVRFEWMHQRKDGSTFPAEVTLTSYTLGDEIFLQASVSDITARKQVEEKLRIMATTDELTGLWNRRTFLEAAGRELERAQRYQQSFSLMIFDIDHFKKVNDTYGHATGDAVLKKLASIMKNCLRKVDLTGRLGGEEFCVLLPGTDLNDAELLAERLRREIEKNPALFNKDIINITVSIGVTSYEPGVYSVDELLKVADEAMYEAKSGGRNRVVKKACLPSSE